MSGYGCVEGVLPGFVIPRPAMYTLIDSEMLLYNKMAFCSLMFSKPVLASFAQHRMHLRDRIVTWNLCRIRMSEDVGTL